MNRSTMWRSIGLDPTPQRYVAGEPHVRARPTPPSTLSRLQDTPQAQTTTPLPPQPLPAPAVDAHTSAVTDLVFYATHEPPTADSVDGRLYAHYA